MRLGDRHARELAQPVKQEFLVISVGVRLEVARHQHAQEFPARDQRHHHQGGRLHRAEEDVVALVDRRRAVDRQHLSGVRCLAEKPLAHGELLEHQILLVDAAHHGKPEHVLALLPEIDGADIGPHDA